MNSVSSNAVAASTALQTTQITYFDQSLSHIENIFKSGKVVNMTIRVWKEEQVTVTSRQTLAAIPEGFRPAFDQRVTTLNWDDKSSHQLVIIPSSGIIYFILGQTYSRLDMYITATWLIP